MSLDDHLLPLPDLRPDWWDHARCRGMTDLFFPARGEDTTAAKKVCNGCPVRDQCLQSALDNDDKHGIFGGASERERRQLRRTRPVTRVCRACGQPFTHLRRVGSTGNPPRFCSDTCRALSHNEAQARYLRNRRAV